MYLDTEERERISCNPYSREEHIKSIKKLNCYNDIECEKIKSLYLKCFDSGFEADENFAHNHFTKVLPLYHKYVQYDIFKQLTEPHKYTK